MLTKQNNLVKYEKQFFDFVHEVKNQFEDYFHIMLDEDKAIFFKKQNDYKKMFEDIQYESKQVDMDYLKYNLLFEVVTLEEILNYSLPRLGTYDNRVCHQAIAMVRKTYDEIQSLLKKFNLNLIDVVPGDKFNGKIHEVTVVEDSEAYNKGQIIRLETKGYIYKNIPVVRAHVIVAK
jgi:molecular chaperone GrpE (heat shock protein)